jgi:hypothetical protein
MKKAFHGADPDGAMQEVAGCPVFLRAAFLGYLSLVSCPALGGIGG